MAECQGTYLTSTRKSRVNGSKPIYPIRQCPPLILLSLPLNYIMSLIASQRRVMLGRNMQAAEQTSVPPCQSGEFNTVVGKEEDFALYELCERGVNTKNEKGKFEKKRMDAGVVVA